MTSCHGDDLFGEVEVGGGVVAVDDRSVADGDGVVKGLELPVEGVVEADRVVGGDR